MLVSAFALVEISETLNPYTTEEKQDLQKQVKEMTEKTFKIMIGLVMWVLSVIAAIGTFVLWAKLDEWKRFPSGDLYFVGRDMWVLVPILLVLCLLFVVIGFNVMYEAGAFEEYQEQANAEKG